ncbi:MAG: hypothetical protein HY352_02560 [Candidatus Omnitrophica bacterium]|nr:hypothetical protein [Candidatus Omnitrophota bacterium]
MSYSGALEAPDPRRVQGATTMAYKEPRYVEEERRRNRPEMAPPHHVRLGGALLALAVVARRSRTAISVRHAPRASAIIQDRSRQCVTITHRYQLTDGP